MVGFVTCERLAHLSTVLTVAVLAVLSACATEPFPVVERLDEKTAVTITNSRTPIIMSPDVPYVRDEARDYVQIGVVEVNRMGSLQYFLWLGISELEQMAGPGSQPAAFESIVLDLGDETRRLDVLGWSAQAIGASEPVYKKLFPNSADAYYRVTLDDLQLFAATERLKLRTTGSAPKEFVPWYRQVTAKEDLAEFLRVVMQ